MNQRLHEYFSYGKSERVAILVILLLILCLILLPSVYRQLREPVVIDDPAFEEQLSLFMKQEEAFTRVAAGGFDFSNPDKEASRRKITPFRFDPNTLDAAGWQKLGFSEKQAEGIVKYREKGGRFRVKEDLKKLFVVSDETYRLLGPFVQIEEAAMPAEHSNPGKDTRTPVSGKPLPKYQVELNSADSAELVKAYGIGPATARRILKYREKIGGFVNPEQLREVTGIDSSRYQQIREGVFADADLIRKIEINVLSVNELRKHPYIDYYIAKAIVDRRVRKGAYTSPDELKEIPLIYDALFKKIRPYISVDQIP